MTVVDMPTSAAPRPADAMAEAEAAVLGACLLSREARAVAVTALLPEHFLGRGHAVLFEVIVGMVGAGRTVDVTTVLSEARRQRVLDRVGGPAYIVGLIGPDRTPAPSEVRHYMEPILDAVRRRRVEGVAQRLAQRVAGTTPTAELLEQVEAELQSLAMMSGSSDTPAPDLDGFLAGEDPGHDWLVPGLLERTDRAVVTAEEGRGKSTLLRQFGFQAAAGIHPFTLQAIPPVRVLLVDLENSAGQVRRKLRPLRQIAEPTPGHLRVEIRPQGLDIQLTSDRAWLRDLVRVNEPELLITGPLYKLTGGDPVKEEPAKLAATTLDQIRVAHGCAVLLEAHTPYAANGAKARPIRPYGASLWSRWPEFGLHLGETGVLTHWRGQRDERDWPAGLLRGQDWPWIVDPHAGTPAGEKDGLPPAVGRVRDVLTDATEYLTVKAIGDRLAESGRPLKPRTIQDALTRLGDQVDDLPLDARGTRAWRLTGGSQ